MNSVALRLARGAERRALTFNKVIKGWMVSVAAGEDEQGG